MSDLWVPAESDLALTLREPRLLVPGTKPAGPVRIDWSNPITEGLHSFYTPEFGVDLATGRVPTINGDPGHVGDHDGLAWDLVSGSSHYIDLGAFPSVSAFTVGVISKAITGNAFYCCSRTASTNGGIDYLVNSASTAIACRVGTTSGNYSSPFWTLSVDEYQHATAAWTSGGPLSQYIGGEFATQLGSVGGSITHTQNMRLSSRGTLYLSQRLKLFYFFTRELSADEIARFARNPMQILRPANDVPSRISMPAGGGAAYDETFAASATSAVTLTDAWSLNYSETYSTSAAASLALSDSYATGYAETYTASAAAALALTDAWLLDFAETYGANASGDLALTDGWSLDYSEAYAVGAAADLALADVWSLDYAESLTVTATGDLALGNAYAVGNNYDESFSVAAVAELSLTDVWAPHYGETLAADATAALALTDTWQLDYAETLAASAAAELLLSDAYDSPAPGAYDETFSASAIAALDLTHLFTTPNALPAGINHLTAMRVGGFFAVKP